MVFPATFAMIVGVGMIGQWIASFAKKQIPELQSEPIRIWFHIVGEMVTALTLIIGGIGLLTGSPWSSPVYFVATGMLIYTTIVRPGYFAQKGQWIWVVIFGTLIILSVISIISVISGFPG